MRNLRKTYCHRFRRKHAVIPSRKRIADTVGTLRKAQRVVPPWHIEICCRPERQQLRLERCPLSATASPPQGRSLRSAPSGRNSERGTAPRSKISRRMPPKFLGTARVNVCGSKRQGATQVSLAGTTVSFRRKRWGYIFHGGTKGLP